jgi:hypothetical protein
MTDVTAAIAFGYWYPSTLHCSRLVAGLFGDACCPAAVYGVTFTGVSKKNSHCCQKSAGLFQTVELHR